MMVDEKNRGAYLIAFAVFAAAVTIIRIGALLYADANLGPDETQYWFWSQTPAPGYFSKPPMIAWAIAATTFVFGDSEWAVRLSAPLFHLGAAVFLFAAGRRLYDDRVGFWAGALWLTLPGVMLSAMLITTDAPLLCFWSAALYFFIRMLDARADDEPALVWAGALGLAIGLGLLSKYAMLYFFPGVLLAIVISRFVRRNIRWRDAALAALVAALVFSPNIFWNAENSFQTLSHTAANANWSGELFHPVALLGFWGAQAGVVGPLTIVLLAWSISATLAKPRDTELPEHFALLSFIAAPLIIVSVQAFISRAHGNWAASAYPAAVILIGAWAVYGERVRWLAATVGLNVILGLVLMANIVSFPVADQLGASRALASIRGWEAQGQEIAAAAQGYDAILTDDRDIMGAILFYARTEDSAPPVVALNSNHRVDHHYEAFNAFDPARQNRLLLVSPHPDAHEVKGAFATIRPVGSTTADLKHGGVRTLYLFEVSGYAKN